MENFIHTNINFILLLLLIFLAASAVFNAITLKKVSEIKEKSNSFFSGKNGKDLESVIESHSKNLQEIDNDIQELFKASNEIYNLSHKGIHKVGLVRFNPFQDLGGDQSFALALLNGKNSGIVISSLHTREGTRIYSKPIQNGHSEKYSLTTEEKEAIEKATINDTKKKKKKK